MQAKFDFMFRYRYITIILIYSICHFPLFLLWDSKYWDDWLLFGIDRESLLNTFNEAGFQFVGHVHLVLREYGPQLYKCLTFFCSLIPPLALLKIFKYLGLSDRRAFWVCLLASVLPFHLSRVAAINLPSVIYTSFFFIAWVLLLNNFSGKRNLFLLIIASVLFSVSFFYHSLAAFYLIVLLTYFYPQRHRFIFWSLRNFIVILPLFVFSLQRIIFKPYGAYTGYNSIKIEPASLIPAALNTLLEFINPSTPVGAFFLFYVLPILVVGFILSNIKKNELLGKLRFYFLAILALCFVVFPYILAGKYPSFIDWGSRLQLNVALGVALLFVESEVRIQAYFRSKVSFRIPFFLAPLCVSFSILLWWSNYIEYEVDWIKQVSIVQQINQHQDLKTHKAYIYSDEAIHLNANARHYRFYEVAGMLRDGGISNVEIVTSNYEVQSALRSGMSWSQYLQNMEPFLTDLYLLKKSTHPETIGLLTISSIPPAGISKTKIAIIGWYLRNKNENKFIQYCINNTWISIITILNTDTN